MALDHGYGAGRKRKTPKERRKAQLKQELLEKVGRPRINRPPEEPSFGDPQPAPAPSAPVAKRLKARLKPSVKRAERTERRKKRFLKDSEISPFLRRTVVVLDNRGGTKISLTQRGAVTSATQNNWRQKRVANPFINGVAATLHACGYRLAILDPEGNVFTADIDDDY